MDWQKLKRLRIFEFEVRESQNSYLWTIAGILSVGFLGIIDYLTGNEITFSLFYLAPIVLVTWIVNLSAGFLISFLSALSWLAAEYEAGQRYSSPGLYFWNTLIRSSFFVIVTYLVDQLQKARREEQLTARTDFVSGAANARYFNELLEVEVARIRRYPHPFTVVYVDIDNFKLVNDLFGHQMGDEALRSIAGELKAQLRSTDIVARLGGDEFGLLLPSTDPLQSQVVIAKVHAYLMEAMRQRNWPITFSMGAVTCVAPPFSAEHLVNLADQLMYTVKNSTKNNFRCAIWDGKKLQKTQIGETRIQPHQ